MIGSLRAAALVAALAPVACSAGTPAAKPAATAPPATPAPAASSRPSSEPPASAPIYDTYMIGKREIDWKKQVCVQSNRRLFINFGTNDCRLCRVVNDAMNEPKFYSPFARQFVPAYIDVSPGSPNLELLRDWRIDPSKGLPAIVILDEKGNFTEATQDGEMARLAEKGKEAVQVWISSRFYPDE